MWLHAAKPRVAVDVFLRNAEKYTAGWDVYANEGLPDEEVLFSRLA